MKRIRFYYSGLLTLALLLCCVSCSEDRLESVAKDKETLTVTFDIAGIEGITPITRSGDYGDKMNDYIKKLYIFTDTKLTSSSRANESSPFENYKLSEVKNITESRFTLDLSDKYNYAFVFIAYEDDYEKEGMVCDNSNDAPLIEGQKGYSYKNCYIKAVSEIQTDLDLGYPVYEKKQSAHQPFMIYGAGFSLPGFNETGYIHETVILKRQMGAVTFKTSTNETINENVTCKVLTDYYRLYLSQILEASQSGTRNHTNDYFGSQFTPMIYCEFPNGDTDTPGEYTFYLPCTTTRLEIDANHLDEQANYTKDGGQFATLADLQTSISWGSNKYASTTRFPIFPNRRTILTVNKDGNLESVHFTTIDGNNDKIDVEDDWNGIN